jgi:UDP-N-acetyl-D-mannosaminuronic acid transferase (WecB/TagA/CpsF family)
VGKAARAWAIHGVSRSFVVLANVNRQGAIWLRRQGLERPYCALQEPLRLGPGSQQANLSFIALTARKTVRRLASAERLAPAVNYL